MRDLWARYRMASFLFKYLYKYLAMVIFHFWLIVFCVVFFYVLMMLRYEQ